MLEKDAREGGGGKSVFLIALASQRSSLFLGGGRSILKNLPLSHHKRPLSPLQQVPSSPLLRRCVYSGRTR